ncbi:hypothetical protein MAR_017078 [Mya arenaria]|uniref:Uncharacterized protein n=1 Tax=Mya arenaria TaxID=6604 RepID=A0ABY7EDK7_MYAAR|nr:hypothetical protein MAR_017078 [Mya arenaria]
MDLFRSRNRPVNQTGEVTIGQDKRHAGLSGSLDNLLDIGDADDCHDTATDESSSGSVILKSKNAAELSSPKLKAFFKQFVRHWNKRKLAGKYYRCSTLPDSPAPLTPKKSNFLFDSHVTRESPLKTFSEDISEKAPQTSPFVTFGKTPPKMFKSKKLNIFGSGKDVALISIAPLGSPQEHYLVPPKIDVKSTTHTTAIKEKSKMPRGATPFKLSAQHWSATVEVDCDPAASQNQRGNWPAPPTDTEIKGGNCVTSSDSPHMPPPPPPRVESLKKASSGTQLSANYSDPYDTLPDTKTRISSTSDYQDPLDCVSVNANCRTIPHNTKVVLTSLSSQNDEPDLSLYSKPVIEKRLSKEELENMYAKPVKRLKSDSSSEKTKDHSELLNEIMDHINNKGEVGAQSKKPDPEYATIEECRQEGKLHVESKDEGGKKKDSLYKKVSPPKFANLSRVKKRTIMAASTEKIYETYLSFGRKTKLQRDGQQGPSEESGSGFLPLRQRCHSQPDISIGDNIKVFDIDLDSDQGTGNDTQKYVYSSFKPSDMSSTHSLCGSTGGSQRLLKEKAKSFDDGLRDMEAPGTPVILATPSFDSLCNVTPLSHNSLSLKSLSTEKSGSSESLLSHEAMSTSTTSSLSYGPDEKSGSLQSLHSEKSLSPVKEEDEADNECNKPDNGPLDKEAYRTGVIPLTPGKLSALKHGIDFSNYLLKPVHTNEDAVNRKDFDTNKDKETKDKNESVQIKEALSGVKTKVDSLKVNNRKETERRHTVQTVAEIKFSTETKKLAVAPGIGVASRSRNTRKEAVLPGGKGRCLSTEGRSESESKRKCVEGPGVKSVCPGIRDRGYLETDLDSVGDRRPHVIMKKSKSHSGFDTGASNVVTDIW